MAERKSFLLRVDAALWADIERWAAEDLRSTNGQVEFILREAMRRRRGTAGAAPAGEGAAAAPSPGEPAGQWPGLGGR
jgi:hypothetical protein